MAPVRCVLRGGGGGHHREQGELHRGENKVQGWLSPKLTSQLANKSHFAGAGREILKFTAEIKPLGYCLLGVVRAGRRSEDHLPGVG